MCNWEPLFRMVLAGELWFPIAQINVNGLLTTVLTFIPWIHTLNPNVTLFDPVFLQYFKNKSTFFYIIVFGLYMIKSIMNTLYWSYVWIWTRTGLFCTHRWMWWWYVCNGSFHGHVPRRLCARKRRYYLIQKTTAPKDSKKNKLHLPIINVWDLFVI